MAENSMRDAILSVVEAKGGSAEGVGPLDRDALDRLLDVMAGSDQPVTSGMSDAQVVRALAQYAHGGGGGEYSITCKIVDMQTWTLTDMPSRVSVAVFDEELYEWIPDSDPEFVDKAPSGTIMYASWYEEGPCHAQFVGTVNPESTPLGAVQVLSAMSGDSITTFPMANTDILVLYVEGR